MALQSTRLRVIQAGWWRGLAAPNANLCTLLSSLVSGMRVVKSRAQHPLTVAKLNLLSCLEAGAWLGTHRLKVSEHFCFPESLGCLRIIPSLLFCTQELSGVSSERKTRTPVLVSAWKERGARTGSCAVKLPLRRIRLRSRLRLQLRGGPGLHSFDHVFRASLRNVWFHSALRVGCQAFVKSSARSKHPIPRLDLHHAPAAAAAACGWATRKESCEGDCGCSGVPFECLGTLPTHKQPLTAPSPF